MGKLKDKMAGDLTLRGLSESTRTAYLRCAAAYVRHYMKPPGQMGRHEVRDYLLTMLEKRKWKPATYNVHASALKFLYAHTLERPQEVAWIGWMKVTYHPPAILNDEEVQRLLGTGPADRV